MQSNDFENIFLSNQVELYQEVIELDSFKLGVFTLRNLHRHSETNEDSLFISKLEQRIRLGIADGAGGHPKGKEASFEVLDELKNISEESLLTQIERANERVLQLKAGAKTTLSFCEIKEGRVSFHSIGDSEIIYWNAAGRELYSSMPHSPAGLKVEAGITSQEESLKDPERHIVHSLMGDEFVSINSTTSFELKKGHSLLIGSDGIFDNLSHESLGEKLAFGNFEESFKEVCDLCIKQDESSWLKYDDISFIFFRKVRP